MELMLTIILWGWIGALFGSFAGAQVWRLRAKQLTEDQQAGEKVNQHEAARLKRLMRPVMKDRSECLYCHHTLAWYDLLPVISWMTLRGRCRYCSHQIGWMEPLMELSVATVFVVSYFAWPQALDSSLSIAAFAVWLIACVIMAILFAYDTKWYLLPFSINVLLIGISAIFFVLYTMSGGNVGVPIWSTIFALAITAGLYYIFSVMGWSGLGDSILGVSLALFLGKWELAFLAVFLANLLGCLLLVPLAIRGKLHRRLHIPFGPFLMLGTVTAFLWGDALIRIGMQLSDALLIKLML